MYQAEVMATYKVCECIRQAEQKSFSSKFKNSIRSKVLTWADGANECKSEMDTETQGYSSELWRWRTC